MMTISWRFASTIPLLAALCLGQPRPRGGIYCFSEANGGSFEVSESGELVDRRQGLSASTGVNKPGEAIALSATEVLVCGVTGLGAALIEHWSSATGALLLSSSSSSGGGDYWNIAYDTTSSRLYILEDWNGTAMLWEVTWSPGNSLSTALWSPLVSSSELPDLNDLPDIEVYEDPLNPGAYYPWVGLDVLQPIPGVMVQGGPGTTTLVEYSPFGPFDGQELMLCWESLSKGCTTVDVKGQENSTIEVVDVLSGVVVGTTSIPVGASQATVQLTQSAELGRWYAPRLQGHVTDPDLSHYCVRRYGSPGATQGGLQLSHLPSLCDAQRGNPDFYLEIQITADPAPAQTIDVSGFALVGLGLRDPNLGDPIVTTPLGPMLDPNFVVLVPVQGHVDTNGYGRMGVSYPIPDDPAVQGLVLIYQFGLDDGTSLALSEVVGVLVR